MQLKKEGKSTPWRLASSGTCWMGTLERKREQKERERERERKPRKKRQHISKSQSGSRWRARVLCLLKKKRQTKAKENQLWWNYHWGISIRLCGVNGRRRRDEETERWSSPITWLCRLLWAFRRWPSVRKKKKLCQVCVTDKTRYYGQSCAPTCPRKIPKFDLKLGLRIPNDSLTKLYRNIAHSGSSLLV